MDLQWWATLNLLEFLASFVTLWLETHLGMTPQSSCFLSQTGSTLAAGWLKKSNFDNADSLCLSTDWALAGLIMDHDSCLCSQWLLGDLNQVANSFLHDHHLSDHASLTLLHSHVPDQVPNHFRICQLPPNVGLRIMTWLCSLPPATQSPKAPLRSKLAAGNTGSPFFKPSILTMISSYTSEWWHLIASFRATV